MYIMYNVHSYEHSTEKRLSDRGVSEASLQTSQTFSISSTVSPASGSPVPIHVQRFVPLFEFIAMYF